MKLKVIGSSSAGNGYVLENNNEALLIEAGVPLKKVKVAMDFEIHKVRGALVSHGHLDHSGRISEYANAGIPVYSHSATFKGDNHLYIAVDSLRKGGSLMIGGFKVIPFEVVHDMPCLGFYINHEDIGNMVFITDTHYSPYTFKNLNHVLIECNYDDKILDDNIKRGKLHPVVADRVYGSHISLQTCKEFLTANDLSKVKNIVLLHLSDGNSNTKRFISEVQSLTGKPVWIADKGLELELVGIKRTKLIKIEQKDIGRDYQTQKRD